MTATRRFSITAFIVGMAILFGCAARMYRLADRSMIHVEMYTPGIPLRGDISVPSPRLDLAHVIGSDLFFDTHPPGYYLMMFLITKVCGAGALALRLPSVVFGVASIGLVYWLGVLVGQRAAGSIASLLLAFNGYHMVHSQQARGYSMVCFLALLATILLLLLARDTARRRALEFYYGAAMLLGLAGHHFFWGLLATQIVWVAANACVQDRPLPRLLSVQIFVTILGSPLLAVAKLQSLNEVTTLSSNVFAIAREYVQFFWLLPGYSDVDHGGGFALNLSPAAAMSLRVVWCLFCLWLFVMGLRRLNRVDDPTLSAPARPFLKLWILAALAASLIDAGLVLATRHEIAHNHGPWAGTLRGVEALTVLPSILLLGAIGMAQAWLPLRGLLRRLNPHWLAGGPRLVLLQVFLPFAMLAAASVLLRPLLLPRGLIFEAPFMLLTLACGIAAMGRKSRPAAIALFLVLAAVHAYSVAVYSVRFGNGGDFKALAARLQPQIQPTDLIFMRKEWDTTPILFYMRPDDYSYHVNGFADAVKQSPDARVWVILLHGEQIVPPGWQPAADGEDLKTFDPAWSREAGLALAGYQPVKTVGEHWGRAVLYCKGRCQ